MNGLSRVFPMCQRLVKSEVYTVIPSDKCIALCLDRRVLHSEPEYHAESQESGD
jgi:molybdopterin/thiamine biosynthesis adenylyltransferase